MAIIKMMMIKTKSHQLELWKKKSSPGKKINLIRILENLTSRTLMETANRKNMIKKMWETTLRTKTMEGLMASLRERLEMG